MHEQLSTSEAAEEAKNYGERKTWNKLRTSKRDEREEAALDAFVEERRQLGIATPPWERTVWRKGFRAGRSG